MYVVRYRYVRRITIILTRCWGSLDPDASTGYVIKVSFVEYASSLKRNAFRAAAITSGASPLLRSKYFTLSIHAVYEHCVARLVLMMAVKRLMMRADDAPHEWRDHLTNYDITSLYIVYLSCKKYAYFSKQLPNETRKWIELKFDRFEFYLFY